MGGFDDVRSQESELDIAPDVARVDAIAQGEISFAKPLPTRNRVSA